MILSVNVQITNIQSLIIQDSESVNSMSIDQEETLTIVIQDSIGRSFPNELENVNLIVKSINPKVIEGRISADKKHLTLKAKSMGDTWITIYLEDSPKIFDIFYVMVGPVIYPQTQVEVHEGGMVQFAIDQGNNLQQQYNWISSKPDIVSINNQGVATALKKGSATISFDQKNDKPSKFSTVVNVFTVQNVVLDDSSQNIRLMTNYPLSDSYKESYLIAFNLYAKDPSKNIFQVKSLSEEQDIIQNNL